MAKIQNYARLDETLRIEFEELWNTRTTLANDDDVGAIVELCSTRGLPPTWHVTTDRHGNGLSTMRILPL